MPKQGWGPGACGEEVILVPDRSWSQLRTRDWHLWDIEGIIKHATLMWCQTSDTFPVSLLCSREPTMCWLSLRNIEQITLL